MENKTDTFFKQTKNWICYKSANKVCWKIFLLLCFARRTSKFNRYDLLESGSKIRAVYIVYNHAFKTFNEKYNKQPYQIEKSTFFTYI